VLALRGDIDTALGELAVIDAADAIVGRAYDAGAQARRASDLALEQAEAAERAMAEAEDATERIAYVVTHAVRASDAAPGLPSA
jgi:hypothetical protein